MGRLHLDKDVGAVISSRIIGPQDPRPEGLGYEYYEYNQCTLEGEARSSGLATPANHAVAAAGIPFFAISSMAAANVSTSSSIE